MAHPHSSATTIASLESEPEPDLFVHSCRASHRAGIPNLRKIGLIIEVADSSLGRDRTLKQSIYAAAEIVVYWIVNLRDRQVEVYGEPSGPAQEADRFRRTRIYRNGDAVPVVIGGRELGDIPVAAALPAGV